VKDLDLQIVWRDIDSLRPYQHNNKLHPPDQIDRVAASIREYSMDQPVVLDRDGVIIKGHARWLALKQLGRKQVPTIARTDLSPAQVKAARIADNKSAVSDFDLDALSIDLGSLEDEGFDIGLTGFTQDELIDIKNMTVPVSLDEIDNAGKPPPERSHREPDGTEDWETFRLKLPPETMQVLQDLLHKVPGKPHQQFEALLSCVDVIALEDLARIESDRRRNA
jgi:ParB-like chromosome segregation protein Spo0J